MQVKLIMEDPKGKKVAEATVDYPQVTCNSDLAQQAPKWLLKTGSNFDYDFSKNYYVFHRLTPDYHPVYREVRNVICV